MKSKSAFTIVEVLVVTVIIAIVSALIILTYSKIQIDSRDSERSSRMKIVAGALEQYYQKNGEYPGCTAMTQSGSQVTTTLPGLDPTALLAPDSPSGTTNSITGCTSMTSGAGADTYAYVGDGSGTCSTGAACMQYTLQYREEATGNIISLQSQHQVQVALAGTPNLTATTANNTQINLSWSAATAALNYHLQRATDANFTVNLVDSTTTGTSASATGLTPGTTYYFRVQGNSAISQGVWSNTANTTTSISAPSAPALSAGPNVVGTANTVTCASGTPQYQLRARWQSNSGALGAWSAWTSWDPNNRTYNAPAKQGWDYDFQAQARCQGPNLASAASGTSNASYVVPFGTPSAPTYLNPSVFYNNQSAWVDYATYCPTGTWMINGTFHSHDWTGGNWGPYAFHFWDSWENGETGDRPIQYWGSYNCQTSYATSPRSPESYNVIYVHNY